MSLLIDHPTRFVAPRPLWPAFDASVAAHRQEMQAPTLFSFHTDDFMGSFERTLTGLDRTERAGALAAQRVLPTATGDATGASGVPVLYQPAHGMFYLATVSLVCQRPGLPDRTVTARAGESVSFLLRRKVDGGEQAFVEPPGADPSWQLVVDGRPDRFERRLKTFPVIYDEGDLRRRVLASLVPVSAFEEFQRVAEATAANAAGTDDPTAPFELASIGAAIERYFVPPQQETQPERRALALALGQLPALLERTGLELTGYTEDLHALIRTAEGLLVDLGAGGGELEPDFPPPDLHQELKDLGAELRDPDGASGPPTTHAPFPTNPARATYVMRALYEKPGCPSGCDHVISPPSEQFSLGAFFEPDAPSRKIQVTLPFDTSPGGLKKFPHNVSFVMSDQLHQQLEKIRNLTSFDDIGDDPDDIAPSGGLGMICSLSIPIVTIVALVVLMIVASILHIVFWWLPYLMTCRPKVESS